jgi:hypothetical protein
MKRYPMESSRGRRPKPKPSLDEFLGTVGGAIAKAMPARAETEPGSEFPPPAPERHSSTGLTCTASGSRLYPPATRASQLDDVEHRPSTHHSRRQSQEGASQSII